MACEIDGITLHYSDTGNGPTLVALHGAGVDHHELYSALRGLVPEDHYRLIIPDLPGMGRSGSGTLASNDEVVDLLANFIHQVAGAPTLLLGHSYGAYLARGLGGRYPELIGGMALFAPIDESTSQAPPQQVLFREPGTEEELSADERQGFADYFVVQTRDSARRYREDIRPGTLSVDEVALGRIFSRWSVDVGSGTYDGPSLVVAARHDSVVGYVDALELPKHYPHATLCVIENAGHALIHEQPALIRSLLGDWLERCALATAPTHSPEPRPASRD